MGSYLGLRLPDLYAGLIGTFFLTLSASIRGDSEKEKAPNFDSFAAMLLWAILMVVIILSLLVIGPLQYFVFLVCGSLGRFVSLSDRRVIMHETNDATALREIRDGAGAFRKPRSRRMVFLDRGGRRLGQPERAISDAKGARASPPTAAAGMGLRGAGAGGRHRIE
jgi:hypothetical protein